MTAHVVDELQVARLVAAGKIKSPATFRGSLFISLRVSGVGIAFRAKTGEWVLRPRDVWLTPHMVARCAGVPLIWEHPPAQLVDGEELRRRIIGTLLMGFIKGDELWAISRIVDRGAAELLRTVELDTSPSVAFTPNSKLKFLQVGARRLLIEDSPSLLDHLCVTQRGVWTRDAANPGIERSA